MRKVLGIAVLVTVVALLGGCSAVSLYNPVAKAPQALKVEALDRTQYTVLEQTSGTGTTEMIALWPLPIWWIWSDDGTQWVWGLGLQNRSWHIARNRAIQKVPSADDMIAPIVEDRTYFAIWYARVVTHVQGKAISIKTDKECAAGTPDCYTVMKNRVIFEQK